MMADEDDAMYAINKGVISRENGMKTQFDEISNLDLSVITKKTLELKKQHSCITLFKKGWSWRCVPVTQG